MHKKWMTSLAVAALLALSAAGSADDSEDYENALRLAEQGDAPAQSNLGVMYGKGEGVIQDNVDSSNSQNRPKSKFQFHSYCRCD